MFCQEEPTRRVEFRTELPVSQDASLLSMGGNDSNPNVQGTFIRRLRRFTQMHSERLCVNLRNLRINSARTPVIRKGPRQQLL